MTDFHLPILSPEVGDVILYRGVFGRGPAVKAIVTQLGQAHGEDCCHLDDGHWCYFNQIRAICGDLDLDVALGRGPEPMLDKP